MEGRFADGTILRLPSGKLGERPRLVILPGGHIVLRQSGKG